MYRPTAVIGTSHENNDTRITECARVTKSNNPRGDWLNSSPTDMLLVSSRQRQRLCR